MRHGTPFILRGVSVPTQETHVDPGGPPVDVPVSSALARPDGGVDVTFDEVTHPAPVYPVQVDVWYLPVGIVDGLSPITTEGLDGAASVPMFSVPVGEAGTFTASKPDVPSGDYDVVLIPAYAE